jgi:hypothetical protein
MPTRWIVEDIRKAKIGAQENSPFALSEFEYLFVRLPSQSAITDIENIKAKRGKQLCCGPREVFV